MSVDYKDLGKRIREIRESKHLTQAALAELAGIEQPVTYRACRHKGEPANADEHLQCP